MSKIMLLLVKKDKDHIGF